MVGDSGAARRAVICAGAMAAALLLHGHPGVMPLKQRANARTTVASKTRAADKADRRKDVRPDRRRLSRGGRRSQDPTREEREDRINTIIEYSSKRKAHQDS